MEELKQKLLEDCNNSGLPLEAVVFVVKDLYRDAVETLTQMKKTQTQQVVQPTAAEPEIINAED